MAGGGAAPRIVALAEDTLGRRFPLAVRAWDGSQAGPDDVPVLVVRSRRALRRMLWRPDEIGLGRAWVTGEIDVEGDLDDALLRLEAVVDGRAAGPRSLRDRGALLRRGASLGALGLPPKPPPEEARLHGPLHSRGRDRVAISHHYDVGNDFYAIVLGPTMVYSCAYWARPDDTRYTLDDAQGDKLDLICRKLGLEPGMRLLDVGCGWGSLVVHAVREYGVHATGITLAANQAEFARRRIADEGLADSAVVELRDWRDVDDGPYDAIASVGMAEHLGAGRWPEYAARLQRLLAPGGRLLNHQIVRGARRPARPTRRASFIDAYVFPDGELIPIGEVLTHLEGAGLEVRDVHGLREHYARTLRRWVANLEARWPDAVAFGGAGRARVWRLYMTGSALAFDAGRIGVHQVLAVRPHEDGRSDLPMVRPAAPGAGDRPA